MKSSTRKKLMFLSFNTDDGIRRAAIPPGVSSFVSGDDVSIPMTVLGGLQ